VFFNHNERSYQLNLQAGYSLLELTLVVLILGIMAAAVAPSFFSANPAKLDSAAEEFAAAMRFARSEAIRTGEPMGFRQTWTPKRIRVYSLDTATAPWTLIYDVYHPVSKKIYDIDLENHPFAYADSLSGVRNYRATCYQKGNVYFDSNGIPFCANPETTPLEEFNVTLTLGEETRVVALDAITGQVTIQ
jgi:type II secretion system protein H